MLNKLLLCAVLSLSLFSCKENAKKPEKKVTEIKQAPKEMEKMKKDSMVSQKEEDNDNKAKIEKQFGEQWDFCKCVIANDSINDALERKNISDADVEKVMARWDFVDKKCKSFLAAGTQDNIEEKRKHDRKVNKCLKEHGLKK